MFPCILSPTRPPSLLLCAGRVGPARVRVSASLAACAPGHLGLGVRLGPEHVLGTRVVTRLGCAGSGPHVGQWAPRCQAVSELRPTCRLSRHVGRHVPGPRYVAPPPAVVAASLPTSQPPHSLSPSLPHFAHATCRCVLVGYGRCHTVEYDDGDTEDLDDAELAAGLALAAQLEVPSPPPPAPLPPPLPSSPPPPPSPPLPPPPPPPPYGPLQCSCRTYGTLQCDGRGGKRHTVACQGFKPRLSPRQRQALRKRCARWRTRGCGGRVGRAHANACPGYKPSIDKRRPRKLWSIVNDVHLASLPWVAPQEAARGQVLYRVVH